jgi:transposase
MDERVRFVGRLLEGEKMAVLCREFGISRKTGYKIFNRYKELGLDGLNDQTRRPLRYANQLPFQVESRILAIKKERPSWGAPKIREKLIREYPQVRTPAKSTVHAVLDRHGLVKKRKKRRYRAEGTPLSDVKQPNLLFGAPITKASSSSPTNVTATPSPSQTTAPVIYSPVMRSIRPRKTTHLPCLSGHSGISGCLTPFEPTMAFPSVLGPHSLACPNSLSGGYVWASTSNVSSLAIPSRTADTRECTGP